MSSWNEVDVRGHVPSWISDFMSKDWAVGLLPKVHQELIVNSETSTVRVYADLEQD
jgi:hypothetical protein